MKATRILMLCLALAIPLAAQQKPETKTAQGATATTPDGKPPLLYQNEKPAERAKRLGTSQDPGPDPDSQKTWHRFGKVYTIHKFPRAGAFYEHQPEGWVRPMFAVNQAAEIYRETKDFVWVWLEVPDDHVLEHTSDNVRAFYGFEGIEFEHGEGVEHEPGVVEPAPSAKQEPRTTPYQTYSEDGLRYLEGLKKEFTLLDVPTSDTVLRFTDASNGLPTTGSWRNGLDVADMNGDGHLDIILPPQRAGGAIPVIYLGDGAGNWTPWREARWPRSFNYGTVAAGDLNGDGVMDLAIGAHLTGPFALLGDGKGTFRDSSSGLPVNEFPTRRVVLDDADGDGDLDLFVITEGPTMSERRLSTREGRLRLYLNDGAASQWTEVLVAEPKRQVGGDWMQTGDFDGDGRTDVVGSSIFFSGPDLFYLQDENGGWRPFGRGWLPFRSYYPALTSGHFTSEKKQDVVLSFGRFWSTKVNPEQMAYPDQTSVSGLELVSFDRNGEKRTPILRWDGRKPVWGMANGDFDGDGNLDIVYWRPESRRLHFLLGDGEGSFRAAEANGIDLPDRTLYDIRVADVNRDGRPDVILMFERKDRQNDGSVRVWLGQGAERAN